MVRVWLLGVGVGRVCSFFRSCVSEGAIKNGIIKHNFLSFLFFFEVVGVEQGGLRVASIVYSHSAS